MPFTISHVAAVLPFSRYLRSKHLFSAAVIGSMAPDFGLFLPWNLQRSETHGLHPLLTFCLPAGLFAFWLFHCLLKPSLLELLPDGLYASWRSRAAPALLGSATQWLFAALGIAAGTLTHLAWDGFTHEGARGVLMFPFLDERNVDVAGHEFYGYAALQLLSSVVGLVLVLAVILAAAQSTSQQRELPQRRLTLQNRRAWLALSLLSTILFSFALFMAATHGIGAMHQLQYHAGEAAIAVLRATAIVATGTAILLRRLLRDKP